MRIPSSAPSSVGSLASTATDDVDSGQSMVDDVMKALGQLAQQADSPDANADPATQNPLVKQLTDGLSKLQDAANNGTLSPAVKTQVEQLIQALNQAAQAAKGTGYAKDDKFQPPADAAAAPVHKHHHHHHGAKPVQPADADSNGVRPDPTAK